MKVYRMQQYHRGSQPTEPKQEFGFYAAIPRVIRTGYKHLTAVQKWLYVCLKDLCGDKGTCYRALRALSEETGISTGMLSESIRALHDAELIHAEKKKRSEGGKEVWHITITDIWKANGALHPTTNHSVCEHSPSERSHSEQTSANPSENVHTANKNVHTANKPTGERSAGERECSVGETEERTGKQEQFEERTGKQERVSAPSPALPPSPAPARALSPLSSPNHSLLERLTDEQADFWQRWKAVSGCTDRSLKESMLPDLADLAGKIQSTAELTSLYQSCERMLKDLSEARQKPYTPPHLKNLVNHYPTWKDAQNARKTAKERDAEQGHTVSGSGRLPNWTARRQAGIETAPPLVYTSTSHQREKKMNNLGFSTEQLEAFRQRILVRSTANA